jgi:hypothetical protein
LKEAEGCENGKQQVTVPNTEHLTEPNALHRIPSYVQCAGALLANRDLHVVLGTVLRNAQVATYVTILYIVQDSYVCTGRIIDNTSVSVTAAGCKLEVVAPSEELGWLPHFLQVSHLRCCLLHPVFASLTRQC